MSKSVCGIAQMMLAAVFFLRDIHTFPSRKNCGKGVERIFKKKDEQPKKLLKIKILYNPPKHLILFVLFNRFNESARIFQWNVWQNSVAQVHNISVFPKFINHLFYHLFYF